MESPGEPGKIAPRGHPEAGVHVHTGSQAPIPQAPAEELIDAWRGANYNVGPPFIM